MINSITVKRLIEKFKNYYKLCVFIFCLTILSVFLMNNYLEKATYISSAQILLNTNSVENGTPNNEMLKINMQLLNTISPIISSERTMEKVRENLKITTTAQQLLNNLELKSGENSLVFTITVKNSNQLLARKIVNEIAEVVYHDIPELFSFTNIIILEKATIATKENKNFRYVLALVISLFSNVSLIFLLTIFDNTIRSKKQIESMGLIFLGEVPDTGILKGENIIE